MTEFEALTKAGLAFIPDQYKKTIQLLNESPMSCDELAQALNTSLEYSRVILGKLHKVKVACIIRWKRASCRGVHSKVWGLGTKDAPQPKKMTDRERQQKYRANKKGLSGEVRLGIWGY
jgi:hypothetical protein